MEIKRERIDRVAIDRLGKPRADRPPLLLIHGGMNGSWCFAPMMRRLADDGWECLALNWLGRHGSDVLSDEGRTNRSILDVRDEIGRVAHSLAQAPVFVGPRYRKSSSPVVPSGG